MRILIFTFFALFSAEAFAQQPIPQELLERAAEISAAQKAPVWLSVDANAQSPNSQSPNAQSPSHDTQGTGPFGIEAMITAEDTPTPITPQPNFMLRVPGLRKQVILHAGYAAGTAAGDRPRVGARVLLFPHSRTPGLEWDVNFYVIGEVSPFTADDPALDSVYSLGGGVSFEHADAFAFPVELNWVSMKSGPAGGRLKAGVTYYYKRKP